jgi:hypothetical protein
VYEAQPFERFLFMQVHGGPSLLTSMNQRICMRFIPHSDHKQSQREGMVSHKETFVASSCHVFPFNGNITQQTQFELCWTPAPVAFLDFNVEN